MRNRIIALSLLMTMVVTGLFSANLTPTHAGGGGGKVTVTVQSYNAAYTTPQGTEVVITLKIHSQGLMGVQETAQVFFKDPVTKAYIKKNGNYVTAYKVFTPGSYDWYDFVTLRVKYSAFPGNGWGKTYVVAPDVLVSFGQFPTAVNNYYYAPEFTIKLAQQLIDNGINGVGVSEP